MPFVAQVSDVAHGPLVLFFERPVVELTIERRTSIFLRIKSVPDSRFHYFLLISLTISHTYQQITVQLNSTQGKTKTTPLQIPLFKCCNA